MLHSLDDLKKYSIHATDGDIGHVSNFYFDDEKWTIRYLVVETGSWLSSRKVLITPIAAGKLNWVDKTIPVSATKEQVKNSPNIDTDKPVSRQQEDEYLDYYGYGDYRDGGSLWGGGFYPNDLRTGFPDGAAQRSNHLDSARPTLTVQRSYPKSADLHLRSCEEIIGYHIHARDGDIGHVSGMLVDQRTWAVRYLVVDTSNWWVGHKVLIAPLWIDQLQWPQKQVAVKLTRQEIQDSVSYDESSKLDRERETAMHHQLGQPGYWESEPHDDHRTTW